MVKLKCSYCGLEIKKSPSQVRKTNFCNAKCYHLYTRQKDTIYYENDYAYIFLSKDNITKKVIFDIEDIKKVQEYKWHLHLRKSDMRYDVCSNTYGAHNNRKYINMPRHILSYVGNLTIDHINSNTLDNRKSNLRICSIYKNNQNKKNNKSGCIGVSWDKNRNKWHVTFKNKNLGRFNNFEDAVKVRKQAEKDYHLQNKV